jgi:hypothetical protein
MTSPASLLTRALASATAGLALLALGIQYQSRLARAMERGESLLAATLQFLSYFTILTNLAVAAALIAWLVPRGGGVGAFLRRPSVQTALAVSITLVGLVYSLALRHLWNPEGLRRVADHMLHDVVPLAFLLFWWLAVPARTLAWTLPFRWLAYPLTYLLWTLVRGAVTGRYPYPFADVTALGLPRTLFNALVLSAVFVTLGLLFIAVGRLKPVRSSARDPGVSTRTV